jgi:hypothetical protein
MFEKTYQVLDSLEQLYKDLARFRLSQLLLHDYPVEQLALGRQLQDEVDAIILVECVLQTEQSGVTNAHEDCNFLLEAIDLGLLTRTCPLLKLLDRISYTR